MEGISDISKWREYLNDDNNFSQDIPFDLNLIRFKLQKAAETPEKLNPFYTISAIFDFTKFFYKISSALSMGFSDITKKSQQMREKFKEYPEEDNIQSLLDKEIKLGIEKLNGDNNSSLGHRNDEYSKYVSGSRTFLRLLWFLEYLTDVFESVLKDDGTGSLKKVLGNSYDKILSPRHNFWVRKAVGIALTFSSSGTVAHGVDIIFGYKEYNEEARKAIQEVIDLMKKVWNGGVEYYKKNNLLDLK